MPEEQTNKTNNTETAAAAKVIESLAPEVRQTLIMDIFQGRVYTTMHIRDLSNLPTVFMPIAMGAMEDWTPEDLDQVGFLYEDLDKAGPRSVNGLPMFMSFKMVNREDGLFICDKLNELTQASKQIIQETT